MLVRRLTRLEKKLKVPPEKCHRCEGLLLESDLVHLEGVRVWKTLDGSLLEQAVHQAGRSSATPMTPGPPNEMRKLATPVSVKSESTLTSSIKGKGRAKSVAAVCSPT